ncbi:MAG TPA: right-handed parallel beta-helix repeat-containing protein, partial [Thermoanaerobaculia bacterium]
MRIANLSFCLLLSLALALGAAALPNQNVVRVDCNAGGKVQAAVDANSAPFDIVISGICTENVLVRDKDVNLRGSSGDPTLDGIRGRLSTTPALTVRGSVIATIRGLSFSNSAGQAVSIQAGANETLTSCRFENNGGIALQVTSGALVTAESLTFNANTGRSIAVSDAQFFCTACDVSGNGFALVATRGAIASLLDTAVTGGRGILAGDSGTSADIDCASAGTSHPCMMNVSGVAAQAGNGARATLLD